MLKANRELLLQCKIQQWVNFRRLGGSQNPSAFELIAEVLKSGDDFRDEVSAEIFASETRAS